MTVLASKILRIFLAVLLAISALFAILFFTNMVSDNLFIYWGYFLLALAVVITLFFLIAFLIMNPRDSIKIFIGIGAMVVLAVIAYSLSNVSFTDRQLEELEVTAGTAKYVGAGLIFTYILAALTVLSIVYASISRIFK